MPLAPATIGVATVGLASALAGQASKQLDRMARTGRAEPAWTWRKREKWADFAVDFVLGALAYKALGGRFRTMLPSDVRYPGAFAKESIPANGKAYANEVQRKSILSLYRRYGCHHCGSKRGSPIGDHMPPNKSTHGGVDGSLGPVNWQEPNEVVYRVLRKLPGGGNRFPPPRQRYYPQCESCSSKQSYALRANKRVVVMHFGGWQGAYLGAFVPALHHVGTESGGGNFLSGYTRPWRWSNVTAAADRARRRLDAAIAAPFRDAAEQLRKLGGS